MTLPRKTLSMQDELSLLEQERLRQHLAEQETLFAIGRLISSSLQVDEVMRSVVEHMAHLVGATCCVLSEWDVQTATLAVRARYLPPDQSAPGSEVGQVGQSYPVSARPAVAQAIASARPFVVYADQPGGDIRECEMLRTQGWGGVAGIPIVALGRVIGLAEAYLPHDAQPFSEHDLRLLQVLVDQIAIAIHNARLFSVVQANEATLRDLSLRLITAQEQERHRIAQELHDELGQLLTAIKINVDLARRRVPTDAALQRRLAETSALTDKVLTNVRAMTVDLRPTLLDDMGIVPTLRWYLKQFAQRTGIHAELEAPELPTRLLPEVETAIYRVSQEALTNVARHAAATHVQVRISCADGMVDIAVEDNGRGFDVDAWAKRQTEQPSLGLAGIQERVMLLRGQVTIDSRPGQGTRITATLPAQFRAGGKA